MLILKRSLLIASCSASVLCLAPALAETTDKMVFATTVSARSDNEPQSSFEMKPNVQYVWKSYGSWTVNANKLTRWADCQGFTNKEAKELFDDVDGSRRTQPQARLGALMFKVPVTNSWYSISPSGHFWTSEPGQKIQFKMNDWPGSFSDNDGEIVVELYERTETEPSAKKGLEIKK